MAPKRQSQRAKDALRDKMLFKGKRLLASQGVRKTSVEDIVEASGIAKGSFYRYFDSKEDYFFELVVQLHKEWFEAARRFIVQPGETTVKDRAREFIKFVFNSPDYLSFFRHRDEIEDLARSVSKQKLAALSEIERSAYEGFLELCGAPAGRAKPGVIGNYLHVMYYGIANADSMDGEAMPETFEALLNGLFVYVFGCP